MILNPCDLEIRVETPWGQESDSLRFVVHSPSGVVPYFNETVQGPRIRAPEAYQARIFEKLELLCKGLDVDGHGQTKDQVANDLRSLGHDLFDQVLGREMKRIYREVAPKVRTLLVVSDEPWIPWEIVHGLEEQDDFFCMKFQMGRWLSGETPLLGKKAVRNMLVVGGEAPGRLAGTDRELKVFEAFLAQNEGLSGQLLPGATSDRVIRDLKAVDYDVFHFAGHGLHDKERAPESKLGMEDRPFRAHHIPSSWAPRFRANRPLVFFNSCQSGRLEHSLSGLDGWAARWVQRFGCSAFLAPLWSVRDSAAQVFSQVFYDRLAAGCSLGQAVAAARLELRHRNPTALDWAAYSLYGHPDMRVVFTNESENGDNPEKGRRRSPPPLSVPQTQPQQRVNNLPSGQFRQILLHRSSPPQNPPRIPLPAEAKGWSKDIGLLKSSLAAGIAGLFFWGLSIPTWQWPMDNSKNDSSVLGPDPSTFSSVEERKSPREQDLEDHRIEEEKGLTAEAPEQHKAPSTENRVFRPSPSHLDKFDADRKPESKAAPVSTENENTPLLAIVSQRLKVAVVRQGSSEPVEDLVAVLESLLFTKSPQISFVRSSVQDYSTAQRLMDDPSVLDGTLAPWGAERLLVVESSRRPLDRPASSPGIDLTLHIKLLNLRSGKIEFLEIPTKKGVGRSQEEALKQASERCFSNLFLKLGGGSDEDSNEST